jgi:ubiquinone/menaquinone biosynthesis C-methylase UbiE
MKEWLLTPEPAALREKKNIFDVRTEQYLRLGLDRFRAADFVATAAGPLTGPVLDIGTGRALTAMALARQRLDVVSVDIDLEEYALAKLLTMEAGLQDNINFVCGNAAMLPFPDNCFGCVAMMDVLHHLPDHLPVLRDAARVLKSSGIFILADFSADGFQLVARVHQADGREHTVSGAMLEDAAAFLSGLGVDPTARLCGHKHDVIVLVKNREQAS